MQDFLNDYSAQIIKTKTKILILWIEFSQQIIYKSFVVFLMNIWDIYILYDLFSSLFSISIYYSFIEN